MEKMKELYENVAKDGALQTKFAEIMKAAEKAGPDETGKKLVAFAKEEGYELTVDEIPVLLRKTGTPARERPIRARTGFGCRRQNSAKTSFARFTRIGGLQNQDFRL